MDDYLAWMREYFFLYETELSGEPYAFNLMMILKHKETGRFFYATDSGCSCPMPWEYLTPEDLTPINVYRAEQELKPLFEVNDWTTYTPAEMKQKHKNAVRAIHNNDAK